MRAIRIEDYCDAADLRLTDVADPAPGPGEVLVEVAVSGVNFIDTYERAGTYPVALPHVLGREGAGTVAALGDGVTDLVVGDEVAWCGIPGSYAERLAAPAAQMVPVPDGISAETAAATMLQGLTAHYLVTSTHQVRDGDTVLVHAAAGGVGLLLVQLCKTAGARVLATASTVHKRELALAAGADEVFDYPDFAERVHTLTDGHGVQAVYDGVGASTFEQSLACTAPRGMLALFGAASGLVPPFDPQQLGEAGSVFLTRPKLAHYLASTEELRWRSGEILAAVSAGTLRVRIGGSYPLADAAQAQLDLTGRRTTGKLVLRAR